MFGTFSKRSSGDTRTHKPGPNHGYAIYGTLHDDLDGKHIWRIINTEWKGSLQKTFFFIFNYLATNTGTDILVYEGMKVTSSHIFYVWFTICGWIVYPYPDGVYTPAWSVHSKATLLPLPLECTLQPHSEFHRCTLGCHSMDFVKSLTNRNTLQRHFKCTPDGVYTPLPLL